MGNEPSKPADQDVHSFRDILSIPPIMPDETLQDYEVFKAGMLADLEPGSAYAHVIADNIIANEWELYRLRRWLEHLRLARAERYLTVELENSLSQKDANKLNIPALAESAMSPAGDRTPGLKALEKLGIDIARLLALTYVLHDEGVEHFETQLMSLERRRRRLRQDFNAVNNRDKTTIDDAELV